MIAPTSFDWVCERIVAARSKRAIAVCAVCVISVSAIGLYRRTQPELVWRPGDLPVAFWAWQSLAPSQTDVDAAIRQTKARTLFLRAGQIDSESGGPRRIRALTGAMPKNIELHLVYNATRDCLSNFGTLDPKELATTITDSFSDDARRAVADQASVRGVQLDFDVPTRLLKEYAGLLRLVRERLSTDARLSITGLSTWLASPSLTDVLSEVDFWIPQFYGAAIPDRLEKKQPIASPKLVAVAVARARELDRPFYAGLAAYGYAIHYSRDGSLLALRGDLDPEVVAQRNELVPVERKRFTEPGREDASSGEWRDVYRARSDCLTGGTQLRTGESMVLNLPTSASLRECARVAREQGGARLLGLCIFRLPSLEDRTTLSMREVARALADMAPEFSFKIQMVAKPRTGHVLVTIENDGSTSSILGLSAMTLLLKVPSGSVRAVSTEGFQAYESLIDLGGAPQGDRDARLQVCSLRRAEVLRLTKRWWPPGARASASIEFNGEPPASIQAEFLTVTDEAREIREVRTVQTSKSGER